MCYDRGYEHRLGGVEGRCKCYVAMLHANVCLCTSVNCLEMMCLGMCVYVCVLNDIVNVIYSCYCSVSFIYGREYQPFEDLGS